MSDVQTLEALTAGFSPDEMAVLVMVAKRLQRGRATYGKLRLASDSRQFRAEIREEILDAICYRAMADISGERVATVDALTEVQARCTDLLLEVRELRAKAGVTKRDDDGERVTPGHVA